MIVSYNLFNNPAFREFAEHYSPLSPWHVRCETYTQELRLAGARLAERTNPFLPYFEWRRLVVDEFHELDLSANGIIAQTVMALRASVRWAVSGSPFMNPCAAVRSIRQLHWCNDGYFDYGWLLHFAAEHMVYDADCHASLPVLCEEVHWTALNGKERAVYESLASQGRAQQLRACASPTITTIGQSATPLTVSSVDEVHAAVLAHMEGELQQISRRRLELQQRLEQLCPSRAEGAVGADDESEPTARSSRLQQLVRETRGEEERLATRERDVTRSMSYLGEAVSEAASGDCPICMCEVDDDVAMLKGCGHRFCRKCLMPALHLYARCPTCRRVASADGQSVVVLTRSAAPEGAYAELASRYGTKMAALLHVLEGRRDRKVILFSQWDELLRQAGSVLKQQRIPVLYCRGSVRQKQSSIERFRTSQTHNVILLSMLNSGSGADLSVADTVCMLDMVDGPQDMVLDIERQAISRCYRIGQQRDVTVLRFVARDTIEHELYDTVYRGIDYSTFMGHSTDANTPSSERTAASGAAAAAPSFETAAISNLRS